MYIPAYYKKEDEAELLDFMKQNSFGLLISNGPEFPFITHLPFTVERTDKIIITSHFAATNPHAKHLENGHKVTVVFNGPHGYISPSHYDSKESVPTWNYIAVHTHGEFIIASEEEKEIGLRKMIAAYDPEYTQQFEALPARYLDGMKNGIVAFSVHATGLQGKYKLSQNKNANERARIIDHLEAHPSTQELAGYMSKESLTEKKK